MAEPLEPLVRCAECRRALRDHESTDGWREEFDDIGELYAFCPECWDREFGNRTGQLDTAS